MFARLSKGSQIKLSNSFFDNLHEAYITWNSNSPKYTNSHLWRFMNSKNVEIHEALLRNDRSAKPLLEMATQTNLYYGVDNIAKDLIVQMPKKSKQEAENLCQILTKLAEAFALKLMANPEQRGTKGEIKPIQSKTEFEAILDRIKLDFIPDLKFVNPFPGEFGVRTKHG